MDYKQWFEKYSTQHNPDKSALPSFDTMSGDEYQECLERHEAIPNTIPDTREEERYQAFKARLREEMDIKE